MEVRRLEPALAGEATRLLDRLRVPAFGVHSPRLHRILVADALAGRIDVRVARDGGDLLGVVLAAPAAYWRRAPLRHWGLAAECVRARLLTPRKAAAPRGAPAHAAAAQPGPALETAAPPLSWQAPREAWRIIFVGTVPEARGRGVGAALYRAVMADRPLVARIARDNTASLRLHAAVGWRLFGDGDVVLAVHAADHSAATGAGRR